MSELSQQPHGLHPAEDFLDPFPLSLTHLITGVSSRAPVQPASASTLVLRYVGRDLHLSQFFDELALIVSFIGSQGHTPTPRQLLCHQQSGMAFRRTIGRGHERIY